MKSIAVKALAIFLAAISLVLAAAGAFVGVVSLEQGFYDAGSVEDWERERQENMTWSVAANLAAWYAQENLGDLPQSVFWANGNYLEDPQSYARWHGLQDDQWHYRIVDTQNNVRVFSDHYEEFPDGTSFTHTVDVNYLTQGTEDDFYGEYYYDQKTDTGYYVRWETCPEIEVTLYLAPDAFEEYWGVRSDMVQLLFPYKHTALWAVAGGLILFVCCLIYLCWAAGRRNDTDEIIPGGLNRLPIDLYLAAAGFGCFFLVWVTVQSASNALDVIPINPRWLIPAFMAALLAAALGTAFLLALAAQVKGKNHFWWSNSIVGRLCKLIWKCVRWFVRGIGKFLGMLPLIWQWLVTAALMVIIPVLFFLFALASYDFGEVFWALACVSAVLADIGIVCYGAYAFGVLRRGAKRMAEGELNAQINTRYLYGPFETFARDLNALADVAVTAARKQMHSDRMKTELITNVSHDIKTPLTSIINYVDILSNTQDEQARRQYLEVLSRQSQQMKRLLEDLMEMSKATTGNLTVEVTDLDAVEAVNQALGEYGDRLEKANLSVVFRMPETLTYIRADGRLTWRVLSNLLSNVVKYALPGTRVYVDLAHSDTWTELSVKNISREELNVPAEDLMERFVRGDTSRNTEGSGLGLNIAQSLMEAQGGDLRLYVDGDLFKVTLRFPSK